MAKVTGKNLFLSAGGVIVASAVTGQKKSSVQEWSYEFTADVAETTAGSDEWKSHITTLKGGTGTLKLMYDTVRTDISQVFQVGDTVRLIWGERGTGGGSPKGEVDAIVSSAKMNIKYNEVLMADIALQFTGELIHNPAVDTW
jgi:hypothetical protein